MFCSGLWRRLIPFGWTMRDQPCTPSHPPAGVMGKCVCRCGGQPHPWGAPCFPFGFPRFSYQYPASGLRVCTTPIAAPAPAPRAEDRCPPGVGHPGMAPRRARPGRRAAPGFARGTLIFLWFSNDFSLSSGKTKSTAISNVFERFLLSWLLFPS